MYESGTKIAQRHSRDVFESTDWQGFFNGCSDNPDKLTDAVTSYIQFCEETTVQINTVSIFPNNKPWITKITGRFT